MTTESQAAERRLPHIDDKLRACPEAQGRGNEGLGSVVARGELLHQELAGSVEQPLFGQGALH